jgi:predicted adenine nucleotide alpha hydrolase (AANH) superfamily ATPase
VGKPKLLLHICCAPDATVAIERLSPEYEVEAFFYDPNIHPKEEYDQRLAEMSKVAERNAIPLHEGAYDDSRWFDLASDLMDEPERGRRCEVCFRMRLESTAAFAREHGFQAFATILTVSPHKDANLVNRLGKEAGERFGIPYLPTDLKKKDGFKRSLKLSREFRLYRQDYCGCLPSLGERERQKAGLAGEKKGQ